MFLATPPGRGVAVSRTAVRLRLLATRSVRRVCGTGCNDLLEPTLFLLPLGRYYGGARFEPLSRKEAHAPPAGTAAAGTDVDGGAGEGGVSKTGNMEEPSPCWRAYGGHWLVLPQVELSSGEMKSAAFTCARRIISAHWCIAHTKKSLLHR